MLNSIRHHLKERDLFQRNNEIQPHRDEIDDSDDEIGHNIYRLVTITLLLTVIFRQLNFRLHRYKTLYIIKSRRCLDEDGLRIATATSIPVSQGSKVLKSFVHRDVKRVNHLKDSKRNQGVGGGDLWLLLMDEEDVDHEKNKEEMRSKKRSLISK
jgi:hypothetical protein